MKLLEYIAFQTRNWAEKHGRSFPYNLCGMCAIASGELFLRLQRRGFSPVLVINKDFNHCFVECSGLKIDVTATQFNKGKVVIAKNINGSPWKIGRRYNSLESFNDAIKSWPADQQFINYPKTSIKRTKNESCTIN